MPQRTGHVALAMAVENRPRKWLLPVLGTYYSRPAAGSTDKNPSNLQMVPRPFDSGRYPGTGDKPQTNAMPRVGHVDARQRTGLNSRLTIAAERPLRLPESAFGHPCKAYQGKGQCVC
jgi:hypothetical protein